MGNCCHSTKNNGSQPGPTFDKQNEKENKTLQKPEPEQQQEKIINQPITVKSDKVIRVNSIRNSNSVKEQDNQEKEGKSMKDNGIDRKLDENEMNYQERQDKRESINGDFKIIKENGINNNIANGDDNSNLRNINDQDVINNEFSIFVNKQSITEQNRRSISKGNLETEKNRFSIGNNKISERKKQYILTENSEEVDDNLLYILEKDLFNLRNTFLERDLVKIYFSIFFEKRFIYEDDISYERIKGISNDIKDLFDKLLELHNLKFEEINSETFLNLGNYKVECKPLAERDLDYYLPIFFFEFSLYPISLIRNSKLKKIYFTSSLRYVDDKVSENRSILPNLNELSIIYSCNERNINIIKKVMHHEVYRFIYFVDDHRHLNEQNWEDLNIPGFKYGSNDIQKDYSKNGFLNFLSTQDIDEDKAEVFSHMFNNPTEAFDNSLTILMSKVMYHVNFFEKFDPRGVGGDNFWIVLREIRKNLENHFSRNY
jgi:hypothetical protein